MRIVNKSKPARAIGERLMQESSGTQAAIASGGNTPYHLPGLKSIIMEEIIAQAATLFIGSDHRPR